MPEGTEQVGYRGSSHGARVEAVQQGVAVLEVTLYGERASRHHHHYHRLAAFRHFGYQFALGPLEVQLRERVGFSGESGISIHHKVNKNSCP